MIKNIKFRDLNVLNFILFFYVGIKFRGSLISRFFCNREKREIKYQ